MFYISISFLTLYFSYESSKNITRKSKKTMATSDVIDSKYSGGKLMHKLLEELLLNFKPSKVENGIPLQSFDDANVFPFKGNLAFTIDSHTIQPLTFPGGDIGKLSICGAINDLACVGAKPICIADAMIVEEGVPKNVLKKVVKSMELVCKENDVALVTGDFKVVEKGKIGGMAISVAGIGKIYKKPVLDSGAKINDYVIVTGDIGRHGACLLAIRNNIETELKSDVMPLWKIIKKCLDVADIHAMKDLTRGGLAGALNEIASKSKVRIVIEERKVPIHNETREICELLGVDPLELICEGRAVMFAGKKDAKEIIKEVDDAKIVGKVTKGQGVVLKTMVGGYRIVDMPLADPLPRIC